MIHSKVCFLCLLLTLAGISLRAAHVPSDCRAGTWNPVPTIHPFFHEGSVHGGDTLPVFSFIGLADGKTALPAGSLDRWGTAVAQAVAAPPRGEPAVFFREDFNDLSRWEPSYFPRIDRHSSYSILRDEKGSCLQAASEASASAILYRERFDVRRYPRVRWRWKVENVYEKGMASEKSGDDYPIRIYIVFPYEPEGASLSDRLIYGLAKGIYGKYPPQSSLNYIWANRTPVGTILANPYSDRARMIVLESGSGNAGIWRDEEIDIEADYRAAFGVAPPAIAGIAIMNDSDDTGERSVSYVDYIEVFR